MKKGMVAEMGKLHKYPKQVSWFYALIANTMLLVVLMSTCTVRFRTNDDWSIASYIGGARGKEFATPYIKFINIILAKPL